MLAFLFMFEVGSTFAATVKSGAVSFVAKGNPGFMKIEGKSSEGIQGKLEGSRGVFVFPLKTLETGIDLRDEHMKENYLEVEKYPVSRLEVLEAKEISSIGGSSSGPFTGKLTLHGVTKEVSGNYKLEGPNLTASFSIKLSDFGISIPSYMGVTVADTVDVTGELTF